MIRGLPRTTNGMLKADSYVGRYRVEAIIEQGGMGEAFRAFDPMLEREMPETLKAFRKKQPS